MTLRAFLISELRPLNPDLRSLTSDLCLTGGDDRIRTCEGLLTLNGLANRRLQPLGHISATISKGYSKARNSIVKGVTMPVTSELPLGAGASWPMICEFPARVEIENGAVNPTLAGGAPATRNATRLSLSLSRLRVTGYSLPALASKCAKLFLELPEARAVLA
jgi:hypothetical protein